MDGVEAMNDMVNMLREHTTESTRIHYVITKGGDAPNIVPAEAEVYYVVRHSNRDEVRSVWNRVVKTAEGAAMHKMSSGQRANSKWDYKPRLGRIRGGTREKERERERERERALRA